MSIDPHSPSVADFRCEAVTTDTVALPCLHSRLANLPRLELADADLHPGPAADPAVLIGLTLAFVRQGPPLDGHVPEPLVLRLNALAAGGNAACRLLLDWLRNRNRDFGLFQSEHLARPSADTASADINRPRRSPRERVLAASTKSPPRGARKRLRTRPRDPVRKPETAIIAAYTGGQIDG